MLRPYDLASFPLREWVLQNSSEQREKLAKTENFAFTHNCTTALNMAIKGLATKGSHYVISDLEHNAVVGPLETLKQIGICDYSIAKVERDITIFANRL